MATEVLSLIRLNSDIDSILRDAAGVVTVQLTGLFPNNNLKVGQRILIDLDSAVTPSFEGVQIITSVTAQDEFTYYQDGLGLEGGQTGDNAFAGGHYTSPITWESATQGNHVSDDEYHIGEVYADWVSGFSGTLVIDGSTNDATHDVKFWSPCFEKTNVRPFTASPTPYDGFYHVSGPNGPVVTVSDDYVTLCNIGIYNNQASPRSQVQALRINNDNVLINGCVVETSQKKTVNVPNAVTSEFVNNYIYTTGGDAAVVSAGCAFYHNTLARLGGTSGIGFDGVSAAAEETLKYNLIYNFGTTYVDINGPLVDYNATTGSDTYGPNDIGGVTLDDIQEEIVGDYRPSSDSVLIGATGTYELPTVNCNLDSMHGARWHQAHNDIGGLNHEITQVIVRGNALITSITRGAGDYVTVVLDSAFPNNNLKPGQFINISVGMGGDDEFNGLFPIYEVNSQTSFTIRLPGTASQVANLGNNPVAGGHYSLISTAEAGEQTDINEWFYIKCYNDWASGLEDTVTFDGWQAANFTIVLMTPLSERHDGTPNSGFRLYNTSTSPVITSYRQPVSVIGLDIYSATATSCLYSDTVILSFLVVDQCLISAEAANAVGFDSVVGGICAAANSVFYDCDVGMSAGSFSTINNCTLYSCFVGIDCKGDLEINNSVALDSYSPLVISSGTPTGVTNADDSASNNLPDKVATVAATDFVNSTSIDFRLVKDSSLEGVATNLEASVSRIYDLSGYPRPISGSWDIGAFQFNDTTTIRGSGVIGISEYYVQTLTVKLDTASFNNNLEAGDVIHVNFSEPLDIFSGQYEIETLISQTEFEVRHRNYGSYVLRYSLYSYTTGDYSSVGTWESGEQQNLGIIKRDVIGEGYNDWSAGLNDKSSMDGYITTSSYKLILRAALGDEVNMACDEGFRLHYDVNLGWQDYVVHLYSHYTEVHGVGFINDNTTAGAAGSCFVFGYLAEYQVAENVVAKANPLASVTNNACFRFTDEMPLWDKTAQARNCVAIGGGSGFYGFTDSPVIGKAYNCISADASFYGYFKSIAGGELEVRNCISYEHGVNGYEGSFAATSSNNAASDGSTTTPPGTDPYISDVVSTDFVDAANDDYHLIADANPLNLAGANLYSTFTYDFDLEERPAAGVWSIGPDQRPVPVTTEAIYFDGVEMDAVYFDGVAMSAVYFNGTQVF